MSELCDAALLLRSIPYREHSLICHFLTRRHGYLALMVHKARSQRRHNHAADLAAMHDLSVRWRRCRGELGVLLEVTRQSPPVCTEPCWMYGQQITALANHLFHQHGDHHAYEDLRQAYRILDIFQDTNTGLLVAQWRLLMGAGWAAPLNSCWQCGLPFDLAGVAAQPLWQHGQLHCHQCSHQGVGIDRQLLSSIIHAQRHSDYTLAEDACHLWKKMRDSVMFNLHQG